MNGAIISATTSICNIITPVETMSVRKEKKEQCENFLIYTKPLYLTKKNKKIYHPPPSMNKEL